MHHQFTAVNLMFYIEEVRDWLIDPLATNLKSVPDNYRNEIGKPVPIPVPPDILSGFGEYKFIKMEKSKKSTAIIRNSYSQSILTVFSCLTIVLFLSTDMHWMYC